MLFTQMVKLGRDLFEEPHVGFELAFLTKGKAFSILRIKHIKEMVNRIIFFHLYLIF